MTGVVQSEYRNLPLDSIVESTMNPRTIPLGEAEQAAVEDGLTA